MLLKVPLLPVRRACAIRVQMTLYVNIWRNGNLFLYRGATRFGGFVGGSRGSSSSSVVDCRPELPGLFLLIRSMTKKMRLVTSRP